MFTSKMELGKNDTDSILDWDCHITTVLPPAITWYNLDTKNLIFASFKCSFVDFFLSKYELTQAQVIKLFY